LVDALKLGLLVLDLVVDLSGEEKRQYERRATISRQLAFVFLSFMLVSSPRSFSSFLVCTPSESRATARASRLVLRSRVVEERPSRSARALTAAALRRE